VLFVIYWFFRYPALLCRTNRYRWSRVADINRG